MKIKWATTIILFLSILISCSVSEKQQYFIEKIDSLETVFDSVSNQYILLDTLKLFNSYDLINSNLLHLSNIDTVLSDTVKIYVFMQKSFKRFVAEHHIISEEIAYSKNQLLTLKNDIRNGNTSDENMKKYYFEEKEAIDNLMHKIRFNMQSIEYQLQSFDHLNEKVEKIIYKYEKQ